jgi:hypothetical protein
VFEYVRHDFKKHPRLQKVILIEVYTFTLIWYTLYNN